MSDCSAILALLDRHTPQEFFKRKVRFDPIEIQRASTKQALHVPRGRSRLPAFVVRGIKAEYDRQPSAVEAGRALGVHPSHVLKVLRRNGIPRRSRAPRPRLYHNGVEYAFDGYRYYRQTTRGKQGILLHKVIWEERNGPVPADHRLITLGAPEDFCNVKCVTMQEYYRHIVGARWGNRK